MIDLDAYLAELHARGWECGRQAAQAAMQNDEPQATAEMLYADAKDYAAAYDVDPTWELGFIDNFIEGYHSERS